MKTSFFPHFVYMLMFSFGPVIVCCRSLWFFNTKLEDKHCQTVFFGNAVSFLARVAIKAKKIYFFTKRSLCSGATDLGNKSLRFKRGFQHVYRSSPL